MRAERSGSGRARRRPARTAPRRSPARRSARGRDRGRTPRRTRSRPSAVGSTITVQPAVAGSTCQRSRRSRGRRRRRAGPYGRSVSHAHPPAGDAVAEASASAASHSSLGERRPLLGVSRRPPSRARAMVPTPPILPRVAGDHPYGRTCRTSSRDREPSVPDRSTSRCIMDGNGRWAERRGQPRTAGHTEGEENLARLVRVAVRRNIGWLTVFGFSTENWVRPRAEVRHILGLHQKLFGRVDELNELNVRVQWIGRPFDSPRAAHAEVRSSGRSARRSPTPRATPACCSPSRSTTARGSSWSTPSRRLRAAGDADHAGRDRRPPLPARAAARRRARAHERRGPRVELPALAVGRRAGVLHREGLARVRRRRARRRAGPRVVNGRATTLGRRHQAAGRRRGPARQRAWPSSSTPRSRRPPPRRAGRHRHRQDARLPRAGDRVGRPGRRRHGDQGAAGPARRQGPAVPRSTRCRRRVHVGRAQGSQQLRVPAAVREMHPARRRRAGRAGARRARSGDAGRHRQDRSSGSARRATGDIAEPRLRADGRSHAGGDRRQRRVPRRRPLPARRHLLRRAWPAAGRRPPTSSSSTPTSTASTSPPAERSCPSTTSSCSTRPTGSRTS